MMMSAGSKQWIAIIMVQIKAFNGPEYNTQLTL